MTDHGGGTSSGGPKPGDGYKIEIASVRAVLTPLEESVVAARKIKGDWKALADHIGNSADFDVYDAAEKMLSSWGFGMGRVAEHTDTVGRPARSRPFLVAVDARTSPARFRKGSVARECELRTQWAPLSLVNTGVKTPSGATTMFSSKTVECTILGRYVKASPWTSTLPTGSTANTLDLTPPPRIKEKCQEWIIVNSSPM